jgi:hypothetical protein
MLLPWPSRHQRREQVEAARQEKLRSQSSAEHAAVIEQAIERMAAENHFAASIADQIMQRHRGR